MNIDRLMARQTSKARGKYGQIVSARFHDEDHERVANIIASLKRRGIIRPTVSDAIKLALETTARILTAQDEEVLQ